ncbi:hypothetical protein GCM10009799_14580 [Nocardiopsis rhodophaea]|uniref:Integrase catalytic domain-containing protein n=1 Tax=Nocardiopsis rhodophaea TaxID=280238 RepID=A0ABN2SNK3_9ACTN
MTGKECRVRACGRWRTPDPGGHRTAFATRADAEREVFSYIEGFYNPWRRHSANGLLSPAEYERRHAQAARSGLSDLAEAA